MFKATHNLFGALSSRFSSLGSAFCSMTVILCLKVDQCKKRRGGRSSWNCLVRRTGGQVNRKDPFWPPAWLVSRPSHIVSIRDDPCSENLGLLLFFLLFWFLFWMFQRRKTQTYGQSWHCWASWHFCFWWGSDLEIDKSILSDVQVLWLFDFLILCCV